ncbi:MAG: DUF2892 domain-containing protein [Deltaproteobacteria bacterium]|nr:DUF2892 domain-containing protein [Deltaproteobacteria bacterium]MCB9490055.1 DUF2892 domain-containing protein [Deltaproteobacteria bacterium]
MASKIFSLNVHPIERGVRIVIGLVLLSLVFVGPKTLWGLIGIVPIVTGLTGVCPPYGLLGINTCKMGKKGGAEKSA